MREHVKNKNYNFPVAIDRKRIDTFRKYNSRGTPYVVIIDQKGRIRGTGFYRPGKVKRLVQKLLNK